MVIEGTVVAGRVVPDNGEHLPEGARVRLELLDELGDEQGPSLYPDYVVPDDHPHAPYNREREVAILRESIEAMKTGEKGIPLDEAMARIAAELDLTVKAPD